MTDHERLPNPATRTEGEGETLDMPEGFESFTPGQVLGERYQILEMLGRGGMGEVWHAFDLKLRVEVALKALREDLFKSERRLELLRQEVRAAREVVSPNVCRIFDLIEVEDRELVSMEYVDGATLLGVLQERGPLELKEAQDIASQFLAGLEAIHKAGLVHRDIKPENIMLTRAGRVVVMDFGLARQDTEGGGSVSGTPAYMAPEQAAGQTVDARADVYAAGVVLAEMVSPDGIKSYESRQSLWEGVRSEPAKLPDSPWAPAIKKAVAKDREQRYHTAHTLTRALEDVTLRVEGAEDLHPYPGLASFTEKDAEYFFGREAEVEQMWRKLEGPARMLGLVGPSGAGKTSFLRAGVFPAAAARWTTAICKPGGNPQLGLGRALAPAMAGDTEVMDLLLRFDDPDVAVEVLSRWRHRSEHALLVVDQFEELFTQNSSDVQQRFADLLGRLVLGADVHVLLSMRDDFMIRCRDFEALQSTFADLTALPSLSGGTLRRALTQPALQCGYRFQDDELVEEMLAEVEGERGALPLLAFAAARLWEKRSRETGLLTRQAYHDIGGVGGALARHAEATIGRIGSEHIATVRELFRNLVTAEGTRAVREWNELLSIFSDSQSESPEEVLRQLIDARLLTSYEIRNEDEAPTRRVEIIHESLLANWPRLVRWQTQDADATQLRDQLRQAAKTWDDQGRTDDTLWTGAAYREFASWRERYPGGLTETEGAFASAMTAHAIRRKRKRRVVAGSAFVFAVVLAVVFGMLWRRSVFEARRAEAQKLVALARLELTTFPTSALAHATSSLEVFDTEEARRLAVEALWKGPPVSVLPVGSENPDVAFIKFSPNGRYLAAAASMTNEMFVWSDTGSPVEVHGGEEKTAINSHVAFSDTGEIMIAGGRGSARLWSVPDFELIRELDFTEGYEEEEFRDFEIRGACDQVLQLNPFDRRQPLQLWPLDGGPPTTLRGFRREDVADWGVDPSCTFLIFARGTDIINRPLDTPGSPEHDRLIGRHSGDVSWITWPSTGELVAAGDETGEVRFWSMDPDPERPLRTMRGPSHRLQFAPGASFLVDWGSTEAGVRVWDLAAPPDARPILITEPPGSTPNQSAIHPRGLWYAEVATDRIFLWPLGTPVPHVLEGHTGGLSTLAFTPDGKHLVSCGIAGSALRLWPLSPESGDHVRVLWKWGGFTALAPDPSGQQVLVSALRWKPRGAWLVPVTGEPSAVRNLWPDDTSAAYAVTFSDDGRRAAAAAAGGERDEDVVIRMWDFETAEETVLPLRDGAGSRDAGYFDGGVTTLRFTHEGNLLSGGIGGVRRWDLETGKAEWLVSAPGKWVLMRANRDTRTLLTAEQPGVEPNASNLTLRDLESGSVHRVTSHGDPVHRIALDPSGTIVATATGRVIRVGPADGSAPHLLYGHDGDITTIAISPDSRWIASGGDDSMIRLWPIPDLSKTPLHTLPHDELIAKLKTLTNLRVIRDEDAATGWKVDIGPFPGWAEVPEW